MRWLHSLWVAMVFLSLGCAGPPAQVRWLAERGRIGWSSCLRVAAALRRECGDDAPCRAAVGHDFARPCYAASYAARVHDRSASPLALDPCFWDEINRTPDGVLLAPGQAGYLDEHLFARMRCQEAKVDAPLEAACEAEILDAIHVLCTAGDTALTGAGP